MLATLIAALFAGAFGLSPATPGTPESRGVAALRLPAESGAVVGSVRLMNRRGTKPARSVSAEDVLVFFDAHGASKTGWESSERLEMATVNKAYTPGVLAVPLGVPVHFPNRDRILHNVFSVSGENRFDLDFLEGGESRSHAFEHPGLVRIFCNVHRDMVGHIWVLEEPHTARPTADGSFTLHDLPIGPGTLTIWHERSEPLELDVTVTDGTARLGAIELRITRPRIPSHSRKDGSSYRRRETY